MYSPTEIEELYTKHDDYYRQCLALQERIILCSSTMPTQAASHAVYGVARRLRTLRECLKFFFEAIPPDISSEVDEDVQALGNATLHAYLINCCGIFDNMAWSLAYCLKLDEKMDLEREKHKIGLFCKEFQPFLSTRLAAQTVAFKDWYSFLVSQRHPTAHRIPPYIIPYIQYEDTGRIDYMPYYIHSFENGKMVPIHMQSICDIGAVLLVVEAWLHSVQTASA